MVLTMHPAGVSSGREVPTAGGGAVVVVVGRKEVTWRRLVAVSRFGHGRAARPKVGIYFIDFHI